jgi:hypothetical protein
MAIKTTTPTATAGAFVAINILASFKIFAFDISDMGLSGVLPIYELSFSGGGTNLLSLPLTTKLHSWELLMSPPLSNMFLDMSCMHTKIVGAAMRGMPNDV